MEVRKLCCLVNPHLSCEACRDRVCTTCPKWEIHSPASSSGNVWICPTTNQIVMLDEQGGGVHFHLPRKSD